MSHLHLGLLKAAGGPAGPPGGRPEAGGGGDGPCHHHCLPVVSQNIASKLNAVSEFEGLTLEALNRPLGHNLTVKGNRPMGRVTIVCFFV